MINALFRSPRTLAILVPVAVMLLLLTGLWIIYQNEQIFRRDQQRAAEVQAEILAGSVTAAVDFGDAIAAQESTNALRANPLVREAGVYDVFGKLFAGYSRDHALPQRLPRPSAAASGAVQAIVPVKRGDTQIGTVYLTGTIEPVTRRLARYAMIALLVVMTSLVLAVLGYGQTALRRLNRTLASANRALKFEMEERGRTEEQLREAQKMQALGQLTGGIAHDFNNLLAVIQASADILQRPNLTEEKRIRFTDAIIDASTRGALLTGQLLAFARRQPLKPEVLDLNQTILGMLVMIQPTLGPNITLRTDLDNELAPVELDPGQFQAALLNVIVNARDAMPDGGNIIIRTRNVTGGGDGLRSIAVAVEDDGAGIEPDKLERVFEPFFTTKTVGKGTGLGLSQVYGFTAQSGGEARIESKVGEGTTLTMLLPASDKPLSAAQPVPQASAAPEATGRILLVEDNEEVGNVAEMLLGELGHAVIRARNGREALRLADSGAAFDLVFSDVIMPGMSGVELAGELKQRRPQLPVILTTGYSDRVIGVSAQDFPVVRKPYRMEALAAALDRALTARYGTAPGPDSRPTH